MTIATIIITVVISLLIIISWFTTRDKNLSVSLWIFWTFLWIVIWLYGFDTSNTTESIPLLLDWLKTAFFTSIVWLFTSVAISAYEKFKWDNESDDEIVVLRSIAKWIEKLNDGISWDSEWSLMTHIVKLRSESRDQNEKIIKAFNEFATEMAKNNTESLISAIEEVMKDFNEKINNQLWESFKELSQSVKHMVDRQKNYKDQVENAVESLNKSKDALEITTENSKTFSTVSSNLQIQLETLSSINENIKNWLNEFDEIASNTKEMTNTMTQSIEKLWTNFVSKAEQIVNKTDQQIELMKKWFQEQNYELISTHKDLLSWMKENNNNMLTNIKNETSNIMENLNTYTKDLAWSFEKQVSNLSSSQESIMRNIETWNSKMMSKIEDQVIEFDRQLWDELTKSLTTLWRQLTSLSKTFVEDYRNLADQLERMISNNRR